MTRPEQQRLPAPEPVHVEPGDPHREGRRRRRPMSAPSTVFFGEVRGAIGMRPHMRPPRYEAVSNTHTPTSTLTTARRAVGKLPHAPRGAPSGGPGRRRPCRVVAMRVVMSSRRDRIRAGDGHQGEREAQAGQDAALRVVRALGERHDQDACRGTPPTAAAARPRSGCRARTAPAPRSGRAASANSDPPSATAAMARAMPGTATSSTARSAGPGALTARRSGGGGPVLGERELQVLGPEVGPQARPRSAARRRRTATAGSSTGAARRWCG